MPTTFNRFTMLQMILGWLILLLSSGTQAYGGGGDGAGDFAVVCYNRIGRVVSVETLDLYEGRKAYGFSPQAVSSQRQLEIILSALNNANLAFTANIRNWVSILKAPDRENRILTTGALPPTFDATPRVKLPANCKIEQLAWTRDFPELKINRSLWRYLNRTNRAALLAHEEIYGVARALGETNSNRVRKLVAALFSGSPLIHPLHRSHHSTLQCLSRDGQNLVLVHKVIKRRSEHKVIAKTEIDFVFLDGLSVLTKLTAVFDARLISELMFRDEPRPPHRDAGVLNEYFGTKFQTEGDIEIEVSHPRELRLTWVSWNSKELGDVMLECCWPKAPF